MNENATTTVTAAAAVSAIKGPRGSWIYRHLRTELTRAAAAEWTMPTIADWDGCITVAIASGKGGAGKSSLTGGLAATAVANGKRVLVVGLDPRVGTTDELGIAGRPDLTDEEIASYSMTVPELTVHDLMSADENHGLWTDAVVSAVGWDGVDVLPESRALAALDANQEPGAAWKLADGLQGAGDMYDLIIIDSPSRTSGNLLANAMHAADVFLTPLEYEADNYAGAVQMVNICHQFTRSNKSLKFGGFVPSRINTNANALTAHYDQLMADRHGSDVIPHPVYQYTYRQEMRDQRLPITMVDCKAMRVLVSAYAGILNRLASIVKG